MIKNLPDEINKYIISFLCKYCNKLKYLNKTYYNSYKINDKIKNEFLKISKNYKLIFKDILNTSYYKKCFSCNYINWESIFFLSKSYQLIHNYNSSIKYLKNIKHDKVDIKHINKNIKLILGEKNNINNRIGKIIEKNEKNKKIKIYERIINLNIHTSNNFNETTKERMIISDIWKIFHTSKNISSFYYCCGKLGLSFKLKNQIL